MRFPQEIVVDKVIPTLRSLLARDLLARGLSQGAVAKLLGLSQSAVSKYALGKLEVEPVVAEDPRTRETVARVGAGLADASMGAVEALAAFMGLIRALENRGPVCMLHEEEMPELKGLGCDLCIRGASSRVLAEAEVLSSLRRGVRLLEGTPGFAAFIPHVGSNLVMALDDAAQALDVAGLPGGLVEVKGRVKAPAEPEFGASRHVAEVLLAARRADSRVHACLAVAPHPELLEAAARSGLRVREFPAECERDPAALAAHLAQGDRLLRGGGFTAEARHDLIHQAGAHGVEPVAYLLGEDAAAVAEAARRLVSSIS